MFRAKTSRFRVSAFLRVNFAVLQSEEFHSVDVTPQGKDKGPHVRVGLRGWRIDSGCYGYKTDVRALVTGMEKGIRKFGCPNRGTGSLKLAPQPGGSGVFASEHVSLSRDGRRWRVDRGFWRGERQE